MNLSPGAVALFGLALLTVSACREPRRSPSEAEVFRLLRKLDDLRPVEPRLSAASGHAPCRRLEPPEDPRFPVVECLSPAASHPRTLRRLGSLGRRLASGRTTAESPDAAHAMGLLWLVQSAGRSDPAERAVDELNAGVELRPAEPRLLNDLAAAYFVRAHAERRSADLVLALDALERALAASPDSAPARFNRALLLERLGLCPQAAEAWRDYLAVETDDAWAGEVVARIGELACTASLPAGVAFATAAVGDDSGANTSVTGESPFERLRVTLGERLPLWAEAFRGGDRARADALLADIRWESERLREESGDETAWRLVRSLESADPESLLRLASRFRDYGEAARLQGRNRYAESAPLFERVIAGAQDSGDPLVLWARLGLAWDEVIAGEYPAARAELAALAGRADLPSLPTLAARMIWCTGLIEVRTGAFADARLHFARAADLFAGLGDHTLEGAARALGAESLFALGLGEEAWSARHEALIALGGRPSGFLHNLLLDAGLAAGEDGLLHAALVFHSIAADNAHALDSPAQLTEARLWRARSLTALGRRAEARRELKRALDDLAGVGDPGIHSRLAADLDEAGGELLIATDPSAAIAALDHALAYYRRTEFRWKLPSTLLLRASAHRRLGDEPRAIADLEAGAAEFERRDRTLPPEVFRYSHFERGQILFDELIELAFRQGRPLLGLSYSERARSALGRAAAPAEARSGTADVRPEETLLTAAAQMPEHTVLIEVAVLSDRLLTWVVSRDGIRALERPLGDLPLRAARFREAAGSPTSETEQVAELAAGLSADLVAPWIDGVAAGTRLVFVPDRFLHALPFAALRDPRTGRWLAEDHGVSTAPSLGFFVTDEQSATPRVARREVVLIGDPAFDPDEAGHLPRTPGARREIETIGRLLPDALTLAGPDATRARVLEVLSEADLVHYAGHGVANPKRSWSSFLPLARSPGGGSGLLLASDIHRLRLAPGSVVVLSACGPAPEGRYRAAGFAPLVTAFLAAGADTVLASLWSVDDDAIAPLAVELHRGLSEGLAPAEALDRARRALLADSPDATPYLWASLGATGRAPQPSDRPQ